MKALINQNARQDSFSMAFHETLLKQKRYACLKEAFFCSVQYEYQKSESKFLPSPFLVNRVMPIFVSLAFGQYSYTSTVNATVWGDHLVAVCFTPMLFAYVLNAKQGNSIYNLSQMFGMTQPGIKP